jgi:hypothetical protein
MPGTQAVLARAHSGASVALFVLMASPLFWTKPEQRRFCEITPVRSLDRSFIWPVAGSLSVS